MNPNSPPSFLSQAKRYFAAAGAWLMMALGALIPALQEQWPVLEKAYPGLKGFGQTLLVIGAVWKVLLAVKEGKTTQQQNAIQQEAFLARPAMLLDRGDEHSTLPPQPDELLRERWKREE